MTPIADEELLKKIKIALGITGEYQDEALRFYIDETKVFMKSAGVSEDVIGSSEAIGCIMRGVSDLWNYGSGSVKFSEYFIQRVIQLSSKAKEETEDV